MEARIPLRFYSALSRQSTCASCRSKVLRRPRLLRPFSTTPAPRADSDASDALGSKPTATATPERRSTPSSDSALSALSSLSSQISRPSSGPRQSSPSASSPSSSPWSSMLDALGDNITKSGAFGTPDYSPLYTAPQEPYHLHIYCHKHNTHITLTKPNRDALISVSCGNIGFRKAGRGSYDAAYQLAGYVFSQISEKGWAREIRQLEVVVRGFGAGREAVTKALLGQEGRNLRDKVIRVADATKLKFGGVRSPSPRRLG